MHFCLFQFDNDLLSIPGLVVMINKLTDNVDSRGLSITSSFLGCHSVFSLVFIIIILKYNSVVFVNRRCIFMFICSCPCLLIF